MRDFIPIHTMHLPTQAKTKSLKTCQIHGKRTENTLITFCYIWSIAAAKLLCLSIGDPSPVIQGVVGMLMTTIFSGDVANWPELLPTLFQMLDSQVSFLSFTSSYHKIHAYLLFFQDNNVCEGSFGVLHKICLDSSVDSYTQRTLDSLISTFMQLFLHSSSKIRWGHVI